MLDNERNAALALRFCRPPAQERSGGRARWREIDLEAALWAIPAQHMKAGREHRVPLSDESIALLRALPRQWTSSF